MAADGRAEHLGVGRRRPAAQSVDDRIAAALPEPLPEVPLPSRCRAAAATGAATRRLGRGGGRLLAALLEALFFELEQAAAIEATSRQAIDSPLTRLSSMVLSPS